MIHIRAQNWQCSEVIPLLDMQNELQIWTITSLIDKAELFFLNILIMTSLTISKQTHNITHFIFYYVNLCPWYSYTMLDFLTPWLSITVSPNRRWVLPCLDHPIRCPCPGCSKPSMSFVRHLYMFARLKINQEKRVTGKNKVETTRNSCKSLDSSSISTQTKLITSNLDTTL